MRLIDGDWVLDRLKPYEPSDEEWSVTGGTALRLIHSAVDNAPTVDAVVVRHGRWVDGRCSNCGVDIPTDDAHDAIFENECHFCYYCGARMEGAE